MTDSNSVKILFNFFSDIFDDYTTETLLAEVVDAEYDYYKLISTPFYAPRIALSDVVWATYNEAEGMLVYRKTVQHSGNSTIHAIVLNEACNLAAIMADFERTGCIADKLNDKYFLITVPAIVDYIPVKHKLDGFEKGKVLDYAESCLSEKHQYKNTSFQK